MRLRAAALSLVLLAACGPENVLEEGEVIDRDYDDPDTWWGSQCYAYGQNGMCTASMPVQHHDDAHWFLRIAGYDDEGKLRREWHEVTQTLYDMGDDGLYINLSDGSIVQR
jgi:hypothetical protein